jgi:hypothetical protein
MTSDRTFGLVFGCFFSLLGGWPLIHRHPVKPWAILLGAAFFLASQLLPRTLKPLNLLWTRFGKLLGKVTNPIFSALIFYLVFAPAGLVFRLFGKDLLRLKLDRAAATYWIVRNPPGPDRQSMGNQF